MKNIAMNVAEDTHYFIKYTASDFWVMSSDDFTTDDSIEFGNVGLASEPTNVIIRRFGNNIVGLITDTIVISGAALYMPKSINDGVDWTHNSDPFPTGDNDPNDTIIGVDIFIKGGTIWYIVTLTDDSAGHTKAYAYEDNTPATIVGNQIKNINAVFQGSVNDDGDYHYMEFGSDDKFYDVTFDGTAFTRTELTDSDLTVPDTWDISRQLYWDKGNRHIILTGNQMYQKLNNVWTLTSVAAEQDVIGVIWKKNGSDEYTFDYVNWNDQLYYFTPKGSIIRIQTLTIDARVGYNDWFSTGSAIHQRINSELIINKGFISKEKMGFRILTFESPETTFVKGDGIVLTEDDGTGIFMGYIASVSTIEGTQSQFITAFSPEKKDLEKEILENFGTVDEKTIFEILYANHFEFYYEGTIDDTGNTQSLPSSIRNAHGILKDLEPFGARVVYNEWDGKQHYDEADEATGIVLTDANSQIVPNGIKERGQEINAVVVKGGVDDNLPTDQEIPVGIARVPGISQQQLIPAIYNIPSLKTQAEVDARAALILASGPSALIVYKIQYFGDGTTRPTIPQIGQTVDLTNTEHSLTNEILIVQSWTYNLDDNSIIFFATNGLLFLTNNETQDVMNINTERIFQLARIVAARTVPGLVFYLDNNASDIGGYKKMLDTYAGDAKVTFTNTNAVDGEAIEEFATEPNEPGITLLDDGEYNVHIHAKNTQSGSKEARIYFELYKRTVAPAETLIATSESTPILTSGEVDYNIHAHVSATELVATDRLIVKLIISVSGAGADPDILSYIQGTAGDVTTARFEMPSSSQVIANKVNRSGDTMTGTLTVPVNITINGAAANLLVDSTTSAEVIADGNTNFDGGFRVKEANSSRFFIYYDASESQIKFQIFVNEPLLWLINSIEKMRLDSNDLLAQVNVSARDGHDLRFYSSGNDKFGKLTHDDTDGFITLSAGRLETRSTSLDVRNIADNDYVDVNANAFNEVSTPLPDDPPNWKELLPEFLKKDVIKPIMEEHIDEDGKITYEKIGEEIKVGLNVGMVARLALREVESLKLINADLIKRIIDLEKIIKG